MNVGLGLDDGVEVAGNVVFYKFEQRGDPYYVLVLKAEKRQKWIPFHKRTSVTRT